MLSVVDYPDRGVGGKNSYRGNCSPKLILDLHDQYRFNEISDYMCGSGTTEDAARQLKIPSHCYDLNRGFDLMSMDIPERSEFIFWHPPYGDMITYAGQQYSAEEVIAKYGIDPVKADLSQIKDWDEFVKAMNYCMMKQFSSLEKGGRIAVLMGDMKRKGKLYSMLAEIVKPGVLEQIIIKTQHNCTSYGNSYNGKFVPIVHEYVMVCKRESGIYIPVIVSNHNTLDIRDSLSATWKDVVIAVMEEARKPEWTLNELYEALQTSRKARKNENWKAKIRQTLQLYPKFFKHVNRGIWALNNT